MSELAPGSISVIDQQLQNPERFNGRPAEVPFKGIDYNIPVADKDAWKPGVIDANGGLIAAHDKNQPVIHIALQSDEELFNDYEPGSADVPLSGADQDGWRGGRYSRDIARMSINEIARSKGIKGRVISSPEGRDERFTANPFDDGDFLSMSGVTETMLTGSEIQHTDLVTELSNTDSDIDRDALDTVGNYSVNNGVLAWVTPEGDTQIAPYSDERIFRLQELGYNLGDLYVPHSNGEKFSDNQRGNPTQVFAEIQLADMKRAGETMTMEERNSRFAGVEIKSEYLDLVAH